MPESGFYQLAARRPLPNTESKGSLDRADEYE
jgi:hypothetical protein